MATPKKKHLIELMIEEGVEWPEGAEYAAQDKNQDPVENNPALINVVSFYPSKPKKSDGDQFWLGDNNTSEDIKLPSLCRNWHQTIVTREQYEQALSNTSVTAEVQTESEHCEPVVSQVHNRTIEQLANDYYTLAAEAECLQLEADATLKLADEALIALQKAGKLIGLVISIDTKPKQEDQQCSRSGWKINDSCIVTNSPDDSDWVDRECILIRIDNRDKLLPYKVADKEEQKEFWVRSIRRP